MPNRETKRLRDVYVSTSRFLEIYVTDHNETDSYPGMKNITEEVQKAIGERDEMFWYCRIGEIADYIRSKYAVYFKKLDGSNMEVVPVSFIKCDGALSGTIYRLFNYKDSIEEYAKTRGYA